jgi:hypothetical protein
MGKHKQKCDQTELERKKFVRVRVCVCMYVCVRVVVCMCVYVCLQTFVKKKKFGLEREWQWDKYESRNVKGQKN